MPTCQRHINGIGAPEVGAGRRVTAKTIAPNTSTTSFPEI
jgi:hypothetical protein